MAGSDRLHEKGPEGRDARLERVVRDVEGGDGQIAAQLLAECRYLLV